MVGRIHTLRRSAWQWDQLTDLLLIPERSDRGLRRAVSLDWTHESICPRAPAIKV